MVKHWGLNILPLKKNLRIGSNTDECGGGGGSRTRVRIRDGKSGYMLSLSIVLLRSEPTDRLASSQPDCRHAVVSRRKTLTPSRIYCASAAGPTPSASTAA